VAALRTDLEVARKAMREILKGTLRGFSIAGNAKKKEVKCDHGQCWTEVTDMEMYEVTLCVQPMNQKSYITDILQKPDPASCPDCYEGVEVEYDSSLQVKV
jgi:phage head maturation protease